MAPFWQVRNLGPSYLQVSLKSCLEISVTGTTNEIEECEATQVTMLLSVIKTVLMTMMPLMMIVTLLLFPAIEVLQTSNYLMVVPNVFYWFVFVLFFFPFPRG